MFSRILVALDHSRHHVQVFETALSLAQSTFAQLILVHVLSLEATASQDAQTLAHLDEFPRLRDQLQSHVNGLQDSMTQSLELLRSLHLAASVVGVGAEIVLPVGEPGKQICQEAFKWRTDLIVMGRRGIADSDEPRLGSVSSYVIHHAPCAVLIAQPHTYDQSESHYRIDRAARF